MIVEQDPENASLKIIRQTKAITIIALVKQYLIKHSKYIYIVIINFFLPSSLSFDQKLIVLSLN